MGAPSASQALRVNGRFCWNPTDITTGSYPWGGTSLGFAKGSAHRVRFGAHVVRAEEWGGAAVDAVYPGEEHVISAILAAWDSDAIAALFLDTATGATTGRKVLKSRATTDSKRAGYMMSGLAGILYFSPDADRNPGVLMHNAIPMRPEQSETAYNIASEFGLPMLWVSTPDASGDVVSVGLRQDLTL